MRVGVILLWLLLPAVAVAWHLGPGVDGRARDRAAVAVRDAERLRADDPAAAVDAFDEALSRLPAADGARVMRLRLERAKARIDAAQLAEASRELDTLVDELAATPDADPALATDAQDALATSDFYVTWLKRLEGLPRDEWEPHAESARQTWRLLAEEAERRGDAAAAARHGANLEAVIRLARLDPEQLQGLPIPPQCRGCQGGKCRSCKGKSRIRSQPRPVGDARGAGGGAPVDESGS